MGFVAICTALYDYQPQGAGELDIRENELLYILEKSEEDDWWKARKKADQEDEDEPEGLIPNNYVEPARPTHAARALYDYARQTDEEVSFTEDAVLDVYDTSDDDWTLVGVNGEYGFAPANYIELGAAAAPMSPSAASARQSFPSPPAVPAEPPAPASPVAPASPQISGPAANLAAVLGGHAPSAAARNIPSPPAPQQEPTPEPSDSEESRPPLPGRPVSQSVPSPINVPQQRFVQDDAPGVLPSPPYNRVRSRSGDEEQAYSPGGFHLYNINEMVSAMGRRKKMPTTLGLNVATGTIMLSPEKSRDGPSQEWTADKLTHYSIEGKHVFMELVRPSKSLDLHAGAKDTAQEIVQTLGEIAGAVKGEGIKEVIAAASGGSVLRKGQVLYDFMAQGDDEVTVAIGDEVIILDDTKSEDWWNVRRLKNGKEGVMPSSYIEVTGTVAVEPPSRSGTNAGRSIVEQNRLEEERLAKEAARADRARREAEEARAKAEIPQRGSSLAEEDSRKSKKDRRSSRADTKSRSKPDMSKVRTWTDHSGSFKVEAQFIGIADGKIHLHKVNGIKIAVPVSKMSPTDLAYVEKVTKEPIEENMPVADLIKMKRKNTDSARGTSGASVEPRQSDYDWFDFFLKAGVNPHTCERYSQAMIRDSMDESVLPEITHDSLRTLGLKEGDALKVMKYLNEKYRSGKEATNGQGGLFSGPGGALKDNSGRTRPEANRQVSDKVDAAAFDTEPGQKQAPADAQETPLAKAPAREAKGGFDDDAWTVKPSQKPSSPVPAPVASPPPRAPSAGIADLSLLDKPLEPTRTEPKAPEATPAPAVQPQPTIQTPAAQPQQPQQTGATPSFFAQVGQQTSGGRQRPAPPPQQSFAGSALLPPPQRPTSAPNNPPQGYGLQPLQPQLTGFATRQAPYGQSLEELNLQRIQQQQQQRMQQMQLQSQQTGFPGQFNQFANGLAPQPTGFQPQFQQPYLNGNAAGSPFADPTPQFHMQPQQTGFQQQFPQQQQGGINSVLPPALQPQPTGFQAQQPTNGMNQFQQQPSFQQQNQGGFQQQQQMQPQMTGFQPQLQPQPTGFAQSPQQNGFGQSFSPPPIPPMPQSTTPAPLVPQKTGPAPDIKFGAQPKKLAPQPTGRRANLSAATPSNPFGF